MMNQPGLRLFLLLNLAVVLVSLGSGPAPAWGRAPRQNQTTASRNLTSADIEVVLATHNCYRAAVNLRPLNWSAKAAAFAQAYANRCTYAHNPNNTMYGENIAAGSDKSLSAPDAVRIWGEEGKDYNCTTNECRPNATCGHYTQLVWNTTRAVGCGMAYCRQNSPFGEQHPNWAFYVCNYTPPGNVVGMRPFNATNCPSNVTTMVAPGTTTRDAHRHPCIL